MISPAIRARILAEYDEKRPAFEEYGHELVRLTEGLCYRDRPLIHSLSGRVKSRKSLEGKLFLPDKDYARLADITDIVGVRIITHYGRDVDHIAEIIRSEFDIDEKNSVDKRDLLDPDRFGYLSLHLIAALGTERLAFPEYSRFRGYQAEFQVRSILQHAWAEITHDLDYKSPVEVPREAQRSFFRVAGLLELADIEFGRVRDVLTHYRASVSSRIAREPSAVYIDRDSIAEFVRKSLVVKELDWAMANAAHVSQVAEFPEWVQKYVAHFDFFRIQTIEELTAALQRHREFLMDYAAVRLRDQSYARLLSGVSLGYLLYALAAESAGENGVLEYFRHFHLYDNDGTRQEVAHLVAELISDRQSFGTVS